MTETKNIIDCILTKSFEFKTIDNVYKFIKLSITQQSNFFSNFIKNNIRMISNDSLYYYNDIEKLWTNIDKIQFDSFVYNFFDNTTTKIKVILTNSKDEIDEYILKQIKASSKLFDKTTYINDIIKRSITNLYDVQFLTVLDSNPDFLPINNGKKINLKTLEITDRTYNDYFTYYSPVDYITDKLLPNAEKFFKQIQSKKVNREYLRKILGYSLTGRTEGRVFFIWYGYGSNGKSKIFKIMDKILCKQYTQCDKSIFMKVKNNCTGATPEIMDLLGKRLGVYSEGETADQIEMNLGGLKQISGEDKLTGRPLYCKTVNFYPYIKLHMLTNYTPPLDSQQAIVDRLRYIFMDSKFCNNPVKDNEYKIDVDFALKLENEYLSEIFSWIVRGSRDYYIDEKIEMSEEFKDRTQIILNDTDSIKTFIDRKIKITKNNKDVITKKEMVDSYFNFCDGNYQRKQPKTSLYARLEQVGIKKSLTRLHNYDVYRGIQIIDGVEDNGENESQDLLDILTQKSGEIYNKDKVYPNNSVVITPEQYEEYLRLKAQIEKVEEEVEEEDEEVEVVEVKKPKLPAMKVKVNNNIAVNELEDIVVKEVKKQEVKQEVNNIMDEDNDNDEIPINTNRKDKRPLRIPNKKVTHHDISIIKGLDLGF